MEHSSFSDGEEWKMGMVKLFKGLRAEDFQMYAYTQTNTDTSVLAPAYIWCS